MIAGKRYKPAMADVWSSGIVLYALICGYLPFEDPNTSALYKKILSGQFASPKWISGEAKDLLSKILNTNPEARYKFSQIRHHPWFTQVSQRLSLAENTEIDEEVLASLEAYGHDVEVARQALADNKHNQVTTTYHLLLKKKLGQRFKPRPPTMPRPSDYSFRQTLFDAAHPAAPHELAAYRRPVETSKGVRRPPLNHTTVAATQRTEPVKPLSNLIMIKRSVARGVTPLNQSINYRKSPRLNTSYG